MVGPSAATMRERSAPSVSMAATTASITPVRAPRQPACAAPITPASASANSRGPQSAVDTPRLAIGVSTADCGPLLLADAEAGVIGAAHAGWRGALTGVIEAAIAAMETLGAERSRIVAALGPTIRQPNYEVGPEFVARFLAADADNTRFFVASERAGHAMFDLAGTIAERVHRAGIVNFEDLGLCNYAEPERFFSYRRTTKQGEPDYGRHINAIALAGLSLIH